MKRLFLVLLLLLLPVPSFGRITKLVNAGASSGDGINVTTGGIDTTGATLLIMAVGNFYNGNTSNCTKTDSKTNTWTPLTAQHSTNDVRVQMLYALPSGGQVGTAHTFSCSNDGSQSYPAIAVIAFSNTLASPLENQSGTGSDTGTTIQPGSLTPTQTNELFVTALAFENATLSSGPSGYTIGNTQAFNSGFSLGASLYYKIKVSDSSAENPTWTTSASAERAVTMADFKASSVPVAGPKPGTLVTLGVGR